MTDIPKIEWPNDWPIDKHKIGTPAHIHAFGQIALLYNYLEDFMGAIFQIYLPIGESASWQFYHKINNRVRIDLLSELVQSNEKDPITKEYVLFAINCYDICTENRNTLLHSTVGETHPETLLMKLSKRASNNPMKELNFDVPIDLLRRVADEMADTTTFVSNLWYSLSRRVGLAGPLLALARPQRALPEKPPKPYKLTPSQPAEAPPVE